MKKNIINLLISLFIGFFLAGCGGRWSEGQVNNEYSPKRTGEYVLFSGKCKDDSSTVTCENVSVNALVGSLEDVRKLCEDYPNAHSLNVTYSFKPIPTLGKSIIRFNCESAFAEITLTFSQSVNITPPSTVESMITLSPGQQQQLKVTLPNIESTPIGNKFTILESQQYLSFIGNESSCTINANESSCSVTVKANNNIATTVNQTLRVITSEFPTESVFIKIVPNTPPIPPTPTNKYIFVSQSVTAGNFGSFAAADTICNNDNAKVDYPTQLGSGTFKALLNGNNATTVGTTYLNLANEVIATATTTNLVAEDSGLTNAIGKTPSGTQDGQFAWTGLARTGISVAENCTNWTTNLNTSSGTAGYVSLNTAVWSVASAGATTCDTANIHLYCVQQ